MNILLVAATPFEIAPVQSFFLENKCAHTVEYCISGVGLMHTAARVTAALQGNHPDLAIQAGVAGAFDRHLQYGDLVIVKEEIQGDLGAEDHDLYYDMFELGLVAGNSFPYQNNALVNPLANTPLLPVGLPQVSSLSVNTVGGRTTTIDLRSEKYNCAIENMEGAAFHYACLEARIPFFQLRSVSNYVEPRDKSKWQMKKAIEALNQKLIEILS